MGGACTALGIVAATTVLAMALLLSCAGVLMRLVALAVLGFQFLDGPRLRAKCNGFRFLPPPRRFWVERLVSRAAAYFAPQFSVSGCRGGNRG